MFSVDSKAYIHKQDKIALEALRTIPGFTAILKAFMKTFSEQQIHGVNMATKIRLSEGQLPDLYKLLPPICKKLGIDEPEFYLEMDPYPNAYTFGDTRAFITVTSGLIECMNEDEITAVIAHECGHIACHHVLYHTMASFILAGLDGFLGLGVISLPLRLALSAWQRTSELSADRAAAVYMGGSEVVENVMLRLSAGSKSDIKGINKDLYIQQAKDYEDLVNESGFDKALQFLANMNGTHPFNTVRCSEIHKWCESDDFKNLLNEKNLEKSETFYCRKCGTLLPTGALFCPKCGEQIKTISQEISNGNNKESGTVVINQTVVESETYLSENHFNRIIEITMFKDDRKKLKDLYELSDGFYKFKEDSTLYSEETKLYIKNYVSKELKAILKHGKDRSS